MSPERKQYFNIQKSFLTDYFADTTAIRLQKQLGLIEKDGKQKMQ